MDLRLVFLRLAHERSPAAFAGSTSAASATHQIRLLRIGLVLQSIQRKKIARVTLALELRVFFFACAKNRVQIRSYEQLLSETRVAEEARDARQGLQMLATRLLGDH